MLVEVGRIPFDAAHLPSTLDLARKKRHVGEASLASVAIFPEIIILLTFARVN